MSESLQTTDPVELDFSNPGVRKAVREMIQSKAVACSPEAFNRLLELSQSKSEKIALPAIKLLLQMSGALVNKSQVDMRVSFEDLRKRKDGEPDELSNLFDIKGDVIEASVIEQPIGEEDDYEAWESQQ